MRVCVKQSDRESDSKCLPLGSNELGGLRAVSRESRIILLEKKKFFLRGLALLWSFKLWNFDLGTEVFKLKSEKEDNQRQENLRTLWARKVHK